MLRGRLGTWQSLNLTIIYCHLYLHVRGRPLETGRTSFPAPGVNDVTSLAFLPPTYYIALLYSFITSLLSWELRPLCKCIILEAYRYVVLMSQDGQSFIFRYHVTFWHLNQWTMVVIRLQIFLPAFIFPSVNSVKISQNAILSAIFKESPQKYTNLFFTYLYSKCTKKYK